VTILPIRFRRGVTSAWVTANTILRDGEPGWDSTLKVLKIGDGSTPWNSLAPYGSTGTAPPTSPPATPTGLTATAGNSQVTLTWAASTGASGYRVYRGGVLLASPTAATFIDTGLTNSTTYSYTVASVNAFGASTQSGAITATPLSGGGGGGGTITHGSQLVAASVGPWALQSVAKGSETLSSSLTPPSGGFWRFDAPDAFAPTAAWPSSANDTNPSTLNNPSLHGGVVTGSPVTIDGYVIPVGTRIVQFYNFPDGADFYAQGTSLKVLFRGCRFRFTEGVSGAGLFNDNTASAAQQIMVHYCDIGLTSLDPTDGANALMHIKFLGGANHRLLRNYHTRSSTFVQPNVQGVEITECMIAGFVYAYGEGGTSGAGPDGTTLHLNGISSEGGITAIKILRNSILAASPDGATGSSGSGAGHIGYGTQPGQTGYGAGSAPGRRVIQTDCIGLFTSNGSANIGDGVTGIQVKDNYLGGSGYCVYAGAGVGTPTNIVMTGNTITTRWWTNGGNFGPVTSVPAWGSNGNVQSGNLWADDYGSGGDGSTATSGRLYPAGNGPRTGTSWA
jgi:hypothetical protein